MTTAKNDRVWVIIRLGEHVRHLVAYQYFTTEAAARGYMEEHAVLKGAIVEPLNYYSGSK